MYLFRCANRQSTLQYMEGYVVQNQKTRSRQQHLIGFFAFFPSDWREDMEIVDIRGLAKNRIPDKVCRNKVGAANKAGHHRTSAPHIEEFKRRFGLS